MIDSVEDRSQIWQDDNAVVTLICMHKNIVGFCLQSDVSIMLVKEAAPKLNCVILIWLEGLAGNNFSKEFRLKGQLEDWSLILQNGLLWAC